MPTKPSNEVILAAIEGFQSQVIQIDTKIGELRQMLNGNRTGSTAETAAPVRKRRKFSVAARRRMREAQQRRWAAIKGGKSSPAPATAKSPKPNRRLSAAGRAAIIAATKKRWALKRADGAKQ